MSNSQARYTTVAIFLHWIIALAIISQLISGIWMTDPAQTENSQTLVIKTYQFHKSIGLSILLLSLLRLMWRLLHKTPPLPNTIKPWERILVQSIHHVFYILMIGVPLVGWLMVSSSPKIYPINFFGIFKWPIINIEWLYNWLDQKFVFNFFRETHELAAYLLLGLLCLHVLAALKHHFFEKNDILVRMLPSRWLSVKK